MIADPTFWALGIAAAVAVGLGKGGMPVAANLGVPLLALAVPPLTATALLAPVFVISDLFGLWAYWRDFDRRVVAIIAAGATLGVGFGWATASLVPDALVEGLVGLIGLVFGLRLLFMRGNLPQRRPAQVGPGLFWGGVTGFTSFVAHAGGPPWQVYVLPLGLSKTRFAGTNTVSFAYINAIKLAAYATLGQLSLANLKVAAVLSLPAALAVLAGVWLVKILPQRLFFTLVTWALVMVSLRLLWQAAT